MSDHINDGGAAFPVAGFGPFPNGEMVYGQEGMTLRDWFAGQALSGKCGWSAIAEVSPDDLADDAFRIADAMIAAREEGLNKSVRLSPTGITKLQAEEYFNQGEPLPVIAAHGETSKREDDK